jgi:hypothetical protein
MLGFFARLFPALRASFTQSHLPIVRTLLVVGMISCLGVLVQKFPRASALAAALCIEGLCFLSPTLLNIGFGYFGFALLILAAASPDNEINRNSINSALGLVMGASYTYSGLSKLLNPRWRSGEALSIIVTDPLFNWNYTEFLIANPFLCQILTWAVITIEGVYFFALFSQKTWLRQGLWLGMAAIFLGILILFEFPFTIVGVLLLHTSTFPTEPQRWNQLVRLPSIPKVRPPRPEGGGA